MLHRTWKKMLISALLFTSILITNWQTQNTAHADGPTQVPDITSTLTLEWLPDPQVAPYLENDVVLKRPNSDAISKAPDLFFDDDDFIYTSDIGLRVASGGASNVIPDYTQAELSLGSRGFNFCPKNMRCGPSDGNRASGSSGGALTPELIQFLERMTRKQTVDELALHAFGESNPSDAARHVLRNITNPNNVPVIGRQPVPQANTPQFNNLFNAGVGSNNQIARPLNQTVLRANSTPLSPLGTQFRNQLDSYFNRPAAATQAVAGPQLAQPANTPTAPCYTPVGPLTYATFVNLSYQYVLINWVNETCQEVSYAVIPPRRIYYQQSYLNYTWRVRGALTGQYVGQITPTSANPRPLFYVFQTGVAQIESKTTEGQRVAQTDPLARLGQLQSQFQALGNRQTDIFYSNSQLAALRAERIRLLYYFMYTDPLYVYVEQQLEEMYRQIYTSRPSYNYTVNLAAAIDSWTAPPANSSIAKTRFIQRQVLALWQDQLENEVGAYLKANPSISQQITQTELWLAQRYDAIRASSGVDATVQDWLQRYTTAYNNSLNPLRPEAAQFMQDNPTFSAYVQLRDEIAELLPQFENHPNVDALIFDIATVENDPTITQAVNQAYAHYLDQIGEALDQSNFDEESEYFYAQLNNLVKSDPTYQQLANAHSNAVQAVQTYLRNVHNAVANCYAWYGNSCNPYTAPNVQAVVNNVQLWQLLAPVAEAHDAHSRYWHAFYQRTDYQNLQRLAQSRMQAAQAPVLPLFEQARQQFEQQVRAIPQIQQLETKFAQTISAFRSPQQTNALADGADFPSNELNQKLNQLTELEKELTGQNEQPVYLPLVLK